MKMLRTALIIVCVITISPTVKSQVKTNSVEAIKDISGCYHIGHDEYGVLTLKPDRTFEWIRGNGTWSMKKVFGIPFPAEVIILKYPTGKKERLRYFSDIKAIDIGRKPYMRRISCK